MTPDALTFTKGHGTGNDFVLLPDPDDTFELTAELAVALCDRRTGLGADGVLRVAPAPGGGWFMDHRNADGSHAEMCGNGIRVFARYLVTHGHAAAGQLSILTRGGPRTVLVPALGDVTVDMGAPDLSGPDRVVRVATVTAGSATAGSATAGIAAAGSAVASSAVSELPGTPVDMGNPHVVSPVADLATLAALHLSAPPTVEPVFPHGVNAEFVVVTGPGALTMRVHERGVGETESCGTGACAAAVAAAGWAGIDGPWSWQVSVPGGELRIEWDNATVMMTGPAVLVATGTTELAALGVTALGVAAG